MTGWALWHKWFPTRKSSQPLCTANFDICTKLTQPCPPELINTTRILYASHQIGTELPGYIQFTLERLVKAGFKTTLITTQSRLNKESQTYLSSIGVDTWITENSGFDFGMWRRYWLSMPPVERHRWERLLLINDSVIYFRDRFAEFIQRAEALPADMVSLSGNPDYGFHLQSYFIYLKSTAIPIFERHIQKQQDASDYWSAVTKMEIGLSSSVIEANLLIAPVFHTNCPFDFCYEHFIRQGGGFIKRKLLQKRYTLGQALYFFLHSRKTLTIDYNLLIRTQGQMHPEFNDEWLAAESKQVEANTRRLRLWRLLFWAWWFFSELVFFVGYASMILLFFGRGEPIRLVLTTALAMLAGHVTLHAIRAHIGRAAVRPHSGHQQNR